MVEVTRIAEMQRKTGSGTVKGRCDLEIRKSVGRKPRNIGKIGRNVRKDGSAKEQVRFSRWEANACMRNERITPKPVRAN
jgi:hypothetical protein